jgi:serine/threonine protein kinase/formylglycine-generating enzyme required for sulfatase activity
MDLGAGMRIGPWRIERELGRGGMGMVLEAEHETTHARAALKIVSGELASDPRFRERFLLEAKLAASVSHPHVVACLDSGVDQGRLYLALELAPGGSLADRVREGPLPWREIARLGAQIARALEAIHGAGIVHRDLKPANVLVDIYGSVKLTDFGLARGVEVSGLTRTGELLGTVEYMAPEQSDNARTVDGRADLYALGCTLHCLAFGQPPFPGSGPQVILRHLRDAPAPLRAGAPDAPVALERLVLALLAKDPAVRPASAGEVAAELERIAHSKGAGRATTMVVVVAVIASVVIGLGGAALAFRSSAPPAPPPPPTPPPVVERPHAEPKPPAAPPPRHVSDPEFQDEKPEWFVTLETTGKPVPPRLPPGVFYGKEAGVYWNEKDRSQLVWVQGGHVDLGSTLVSSHGGELDPSIPGRERPPFELEGFFIGRFEVSNEQFTRYVNATSQQTDVERAKASPRVKDGRGDPLRAMGASWKFPHGPGIRPLAWSRWPVVQVSWDDAQRYVGWAGLQLPTEDQWECAAAWDGKSVRKSFPWGEEVPFHGEKAECVDFGTPGPHLATVDAYPDGRSPCGAYNMAGNADEWVADAVPRHPGSHVVKGGGFYNGGDKIKRSYYDTEPGPSNAIGFRVALLMPASR